MCRMCVRPSRDVQSAIRGCHGYSDMSVVFAMVCSLHRFPSGEARLYATEPPADRVFSAPVSNRSSLEESNQGNRGAAFISFLPFCPSPAGEKRQRLVGSGRIVAGGLKTRGLATARLRGRGVALRYRSTPARAPRISRSRRASPDQVGTVDGHGRSLAPKEERPSRSFDGRTNCAEFLRGS